MKAMILAAGRGERMRPLTDTTPKPLLRVGEKALIEHLLIKLAAAKVKHVVINVAHLAEQFYQALGDGSAYGLSIDYSFETEVLETGGGIRNALPILGQQPFMLLSGDIWTDYDFSLLPKRIAGLAHLVLAPNPMFHPKGDVSLVDNIVTLSDNNPYTYANIAVIDPDLFDGVEQERFPLRDCFYPAIANKQVTGEVFTGVWENIGTPEQLIALNDAITI